MQIDLSKIDTEQFMIHPHLIGGETVYLVQPQFIGVKWTQQNKHLRSSAWDKDGNLISASYPKFVNLNENPENFPTPKSLDDCELVAKIDGSCLIFSIFKDNLIVRTRGTVDARKIDNGHEIDFFKQKYPRLFDNLYRGFSYCTEWVTNTNKIVLDYGPEPRLFLTAVICHEDYSLINPQSELDELAKILGVERPKYYNFNTIPEMITAIEALQGEEGICIYHNNGQSITKLKSLSYLALHRFKEHANIETVVDLFCELNYPSFEQFKEELIKKFSYESFQLVVGFCSQVCDAKKEVDKIIEHMKKFVLPLKNKSRKESALAIISAYGKETNRASFVFQILDGKELDKKAVAKLLWQVLKV